MALYDGPTEGKLRCNPVGCWREVNIAVFPFRTGICARKCPLRRPFFCHTSVRISGSGNLRKCVRDERLYKALYDKGIELTGSYHTFPSVGPITSHCVQRALDFLLEELKQDPGRLHSTQSKGFLSVW
jgi:hypothetical protein